MRRGWCVLAVLLAAPPAWGGHAYLWEGFEHEVNWENADGAANVDRQVSAEEASEGTRSLKIMFKASSPSAWAACRRKEDLDWSPYGTLLLDVYNPTSLEQIRCSVVISTDEDKLDHEAMLPTLRPGWNRDLRVNLLAPAFISAAANYQPRGYLVGRNNVKRVTIRVYPGAPATGAVYVDNLRLLRTGLLVLGDFTLNPAVEFTASGVHLDYVPPDLRLRRADLTPVETFSGAPPWTADTEGVVVEPATDFTSYNPRALSVRFPPVPDGFDLTMSGIERRLAGSRLFRLDVYNPGPEGAKLALTLTDADGTSYRSGHASLRHGWNALVYDLTNQKLWEGGLLTAAALTRLTSVSMNIASPTRGRLIFDGAATGSVSVRSAAKSSALFPMSYNPGESLEITAVPRVENTHYGTSLAHVHDAGAETYLDAASARADLGGFRTRLLYRQKVRAFDNPINALVSPDNFGNEVAALETSGRLADTEVQALAASRLEYGTYNSRVPTGFGPESLLGVRARRDAGRGVRVGATFIDHAARYGDGVEGVPRRRRTAGLDAEGSIAGGESSLGLAMEGALTTGDVYRSGAVVPPHDRAYVGASVSPSYGRLGLSFGYSLLGYDFDAGFTKKGGNTELVSHSGSLQLEGLPGLAVLERVPFTGGTLGRNLALGWSGYRYVTRDKIADVLTGELRPSQLVDEAEVTLGNDYQSVPNIEAAAEARDEDNPWTRNPTVLGSLSLRVPFPFDVVVNSSGQLGSGRTYDKASNERGDERSRSLSAGLERDFASNLVLSGNLSWGWFQNSWQGVWGAPSVHRRWTFSARQPVGASTLIQLEYGVPPLHGSDYGSQDTLDVFTLTVTSSF